MPDPIVEKTPEELEAETQAKKTEAENLAKALEEEETLIAERQDALRAKREERQALEVAIEAESESVTPPAKSMPSSAPPQADEITKRVKNELRQEQQQQNLVIARRQFYKTAEGKHYDPLVDVAGRTWKEMSEFLHVTAEDITVESLLRKLRAAAFAHQRESLVTSDGQHTRNVEAARDTLNDLGSGPRAGGGERHIVAPEDKPTEADIANAAKYNLTLEQWMKSKKKRAAQMAARR